MYVNFFNLTKLTKVLQGNGLQAGIYLNKMSGQVFLCTSRPVYGGNVAIIVGNYAGE